MRREAELDGFFISPALYRRKQEMRREDERQNYSPDTEGAGLQQASQDGLPFMTRRLKQA